jgi:hypothetical protein
MTRAISDFGLRVSSMWFEIRNPQSAIRISHWGAGRQFSAVNWLVYWIIGRLRPFLLLLFCYAYITVACILQVIYWREPKKLWNHHPVPIISL